MQTGRSEYINRKNKVVISRIHSFYLKFTKFAVDVPAYKGRLYSNIEVNCGRSFRDRRDQSFSFFLRLFAQITNLQVHTLIQLKFGTLVGCIQANSGTNFGDNLEHSFMEIQVLIHVYEDRTLVTPTG